MTQEQKSNYYEIDDFEEWYTDKFSAQFREDDPEGSRKRAALGIFQASIIKMQAMRRNKK